MRFRDRAQAGRRLARQLARYADRDDVVVLALARGGVPVGFEIARALNAPLDVFLVRKLGVPGEEELAMGALACGGVRIFNEDLLARLGVPASAVDAVVAREQEELERRVRAYRGTRPPPLVAGRTVILADDGLATGVSMRAAAIALSSLSPDRIIVAVPVGAAEVCARLREVADEVLCAETPEPFLAVSNWYDDFSQTTDDEVRNLLEKARGDAPAGGEGATHLEKHAS